MKALEHNGKSYTNAEFMAHSEEDSGSMAKAVGGGVENPEVEGEESPEAL